MNTEKSSQLTLWAGVVSAFGGGYMGLLFIGGAAGAVAGIAAAALVVWVLGLARSAAAGGAKAVITGLLFLTMGASLFGGVVAKSVVDKTPPACPMNSRYGVAAGACVCAEGAHPLPDGNACIINPYR